MDIEYGRTSLLEKYTYIVNRFNISRKRVVYSLFIFTLSFVVLTISHTYQNVTSEEIHNGGDAVFSIHERTYKPFTFAETVSKTAVANVDVYPIFSSFINEQMQLRNIASLTSHVRNWLEQTNNLCIHAKYFGVPYDIIILKNLTVINPSIVSIQGTSSISTRIREHTGKEHWISYPENMLVNYIHGENFKRIEERTSKSISVCIFAYKHLQL